MDAATTAPARDTGTWKDAAIAAIPAWLTARLVVLAALGLAQYLSDEARPARAVVARTVGDGLLSWDGAWYADIASRGYGALPRDALRFFPGFPMLGRALGVALGDRAALVVIANLAALGAAMMLYRLVRWERGDAALATRAAWFLSLAPSAFVFVMAYSDALAVLFAIATFLAIRRRNWWWAAAAAALVGVSRPTGVLLAVPVLIEACRGFTAVSGRERVARAAAIAAAPAGALVYLGWVGATRHDFLLPYSVQTTNRLHGELADPFSTVWHAFEGVFHHRVGTALHVPWLVVLVALVVVVFARWPLSYGVFAAAVVASSVTSTNLDSLERYGLFAFPLVLAVADLTERKLVERIAFVLLPVALFGYAVLAFLGLYVP
ncbi:MAG: glycosyltransferase 87 family protein [Acidimicrobiia bacterium]